VDDVSLEVSFLEKAFVLFHGDEALIVDDWFGDAEGP
jgi:hypothetical protein